MARTPECHPERTHRGKGLCGTCYARAYLKGKAAEWRKANPERAMSIQRKYVLQREYGLSVDEYDALLAATHNTCRVCLSRFGEDHRPVVDHDHDSGRVRGIICHQCNSALGLLRDDPETIARLGTYLAEC